MPSLLSSESFLLNFSCINSRSFMNSKMPKKGKKGQKLPERGKSSQSSKYVYLCQLNLQNLTSITGHAWKVGLTARISVALSYRRRDFPNFFLDPDYSNVPNLNFRFDGQQRQPRLVGQLFFGQPQHFRFRLLRLEQLQPRLANLVEVLGVVKIVGSAEIKIEKMYEIPEHFFIRS